MRIFLVLSLLLQFCSHQKNAGGTSVETTNGIAGVITYNEKAVSGAKVYLIPKNSFTLYGDTNGIVFQAVTNDKGAFVIENDNLEEYTLIVRFQDSLSAGVSTTCGQDCSIPLQASGLVQINIANWPLMVGDTIGLAGTDVGIILDSAQVAAGVVQVAAVPKGEYTDWVIKQKGTGDGPKPEVIVLQTPTAQVNPGSTTVVQGGKWPWEYGMKLPDYFSGLQNIPQDSLLRIRTDQSFWQQALQEYPDYFTEYPLAVDFLHSMQWKTLDGQIIPMELNIPANFKTTEVTQDWVHSLGSSAFTNVGAAVGQLPTVWLKQPKADSILVQFNIGSIEAPSTQITQPDYDSLWRNYITKWHLDGRYFAATEPVILESAHSDNWQEPQAITMVAMIRPDSGNVGGEIVSMGNNAGIRVDYLNDTLVAFYAYSSNEGVSNWHVLSGFYRVEYLEPTNGWLVLHLLIGPQQGVFALYINGQLNNQYGPLDELLPLAYDKGSQLWALGKHATDDEGYFNGQMDEVLVYNGLLNAGDIELQTKFLLQ